MNGFLDDRANLPGRRAVLIGGGGGSVGRAMSLALARAGVDIAICEIDSPALAETAQEAAQYDVQVVTRHANATKPAELSSFFDLVETSFPSGIDILVNIVGGVRRGSFMEGNPETWHKDIHRNFGYVLESTHRAVPLMLKRGGGSIINFTTIEAYRGAAGFSVYAAAKAALTNFTRALAVELGHANIRVNTIAPDSPAPEHVARLMKSLPEELQAAEAKLTTEQREGGRAMYIPMGRAASLDDIANGLLFLSSDLSASITGTTLHIDGGTSASLGFINWPSGVGFLPAPRGDVLAALFPS